MRDIAFIGVTTSFIFFHIYCLFSFYSLYRMTTSNNPGIKALCEQHLGYLIQQDWLSQSAVLAIGEGSPQNDPWSCGPRMALALDYLLASGADFQQLSKRLGFDLISFQASAIIRLDPFVIQLDTFGFLWSPFGILHRPVMLRYCPLAGCLTPRPL
jgi:hypothetical protein